LSPLSFRGGGPPWKYYVDGSVNAFSHDLTQRIVDHRTRSLKKCLKIGVPMNKKSWVVRELSQKTPIPQWLLSCCQKLRPMKINNRKSWSRFVGYQVNPS
jgi:hypothetical protein